MLINKYIFVASCYAENAVDAIAHNNHMSHSVYVILDY